MDENNAEEIWIDDETLSDDDEFWIHCEILNRGEIMSDAEEVI